MLDVFNKLKKKTWKREVAIALLSITFGLLAFTLIGSDVELMKARADLLALIVVPVFSFAALAFGMDSYVNQYQPQQGAVSKLKNTPATDDEIDDLIPPSTGEEK